MGNDRGGFLHFIIMLCRDRHTARLTIAHHSLGTGGRVAALRRDDDALRQWPTARSHDHPYASDRGHYPAQAYDTGYPGSLAGSGVEQYGVSYRNRHHDIFSRAFAALLPLGVVKITPLQKGKSFSRGSYSPTELCWLSHR